LYLKTGNKLCMDFPSLDDIWQETLGLNNFDAGRLEAATTRSQRPAYGLTLVVHPLRGLGLGPPRLLETIAELRLAWGQALPCSFFLEETLHFTIYSLRRSRPEPFSPLELEELWNRLASELRPILEATSPFTLSLRGLAVAADGAILIGVDDSPALRGLRQAVKAIPGVSSPRSYPPHVTIGQVLAPCGSAESFRQTMGYLQAWRDVSVGELSVPALKLIYYSSRLLATVEHRTEFTLGKVSISERTGRKSY
jgi:2'-5' RNA ligase